MLSLKENILNLDLESFGISFKNFYTWCPLRLGLFSQGALFKYLQIYKNIFEVLNTLYAIKYM